MEEVLESHRESANRTAPIDRGDMIEHSGTDVETEPGAIRGAVYWEPFVDAEGVWFTPRWQHERLDYDHDPGRRAKWAELDMKENGARYYLELAEAIERRMD